MTRSARRRTPGRPGARRRWLAALASLLLSTAPASAQVGATIVDVRVEQEGQPVTDTLVNSLIETDVGEPLAMRDVRETIGHLMSLSLFDDVQVLQETSGSGVRLRYVLVPRHPVDRIEFRGSLGLGEGDLRRALSERYGSAPPAASRSAEAADALKAAYRRRGYPDARIAATVEETHRPDRATMAFAVEAGRRVTIADVRFEQVDAEGQSTIVRRPDIRAGQPYDEDVVQRELRDWEDGERSDGYYEARASHGAFFLEGGAVVSVSLSRGPHMVVAFAGDPLPESERERLVPVREEGSADEDLLEDSSRAIEDYYYARGYRDASASYAREERGADLVITFTVKRGPRYVMRATRITGNSGIATGELSPLLLLDADAPFVRATLARGVSAIEALYRSRGFTRVAVKASDAVVPAENPSDPNRHVDVAVAIVEGPRTVIRSVAFRGNQALTEAELRAVSTLQAGQPYSLAALVADRDRIDLEYRNRGYESVTVTAEPALADGDTQADVTYAIAEGSRSIVDHIIVVGNERISTATIERELLLRPGEPLGYSALVESRARLVELGLFRRIQIEPITHAGESRRDVLVTVEESPPTIFDMTGGVEGGFLLRATGEGGQAEERFELAPRGSITIGRRNLWGKNRSVTLFTRASLRSREVVRGADQTAPEDEAPALDNFREYRMVGTFREPKAFGWPAEVLVTGIVEQAIRSSFNFTRREVRAEAGLRASNVYTLAGRYSFQRTELFNERFEPEDQPLIDRLFPQVRLSKLTGSVIRNTRDNELDPSSGTFVALEGDLAARSIGSEVGYLRTYVQGFTYHRLPTGRRAIVALGARVGAAHGFPRDVPRLDENGVPEIGDDGEPIVDVVEDLPASERFFAGGETSVRGFSLDRLGDERTITASGFPTGGNSVVVLNSELRVNVTGDLQAVGFVDAGNVFPHASDLDLTDLRPTAGFGAMYRSPFGPVRVDIGFNLERRELVPGKLERGYAIHFLLGQPF